MRRLLIAVLAALAGTLACLALGGGTGDAGVKSPSAATKRCSPAFRHAIIGGRHLCLRAGQRCAKRLDRQYHRYGFHCHRGRLTKKRVPRPPAPPRAGARIVATIPVGRRPGGIVAAEGAVWVKNHADQTVSRIDPVTNTVTATIAIGAGEFGYLAAGEGSIWATNNDANTVSRIDPRSNTVVATIPVGENPQGIAVGSGSAWVANHRAASVSRIDTATNVVSAVIAADQLCCSPQAVATSPGAVWVTMPDPDKRHVVRIDPATNRVVATIGVGDNGGRLTVTEDAIWAATNTRTVKKIDPATNSVVSIVDAGAVASGAAAGLGSIWVTDVGDSLIRIDPTGNRVVGELRIPGAVFPAVGEGAVWVSSESTNTVVRVEPVL
jgi:YVTN family beta-propeller protein